ncbi:hypothetical protein H4696_003374 [Amycolatopsis lexingtonensis]|uniref:Uncharacterized protein n=1 Tax=Amycolatopsis lexingtonensis TaxID=218822 RepID=A0ABR9HZA4_9PSEU|nr:hypothetical protein [Amycolatopsis lexingtonensis]MBE1496274.1 hypothetical protein [Amycolatopsis lexingtonensis]
MQRATLIAPAEGAELAEHDAPSRIGTGRVPLHTRDYTWGLEHDDLVRVPPERHGLTVLADTAVPLTIRAPLTTAAKPRTAQRGKCGADEGYRHLLG